MKRLLLFVPTDNDFWFKKEIKEDPATMDYNAGYDVSIEGYDYKSGAIATDINDLKTNWKKRWIDNWPATFYAYITKISDNKFVGEIYAKWAKEHDAYEIGIVIKSEHRGNGYAKEAIELLVKKLKQLGAKKLYHELPISRTSAVKADMINGFVVKKRDYLGMKKFGEAEKMVFLIKEL